jgi:hypothetical protein
VRRYAPLCLLCLMAAALACGHGARTPQPIPEHPPASLAPIANQGSGDAGATFPAGRAATRGSCGIVTAVSPEGLLRPDGAGHIQDRLVQLGLLRPGTFQSGKLDDNTLSALMRLQREKHLPVVGLPTYATVEALGLAPDEVYLSGQTDCPDGGT